MLLRQKTRRKPAAFSLIELLVSLVIAGILAALLLPAIQHAREAGRRTHCMSNLRQLGQAIHAYHDVHRCLPAGSCFGFSTHVAILPQMEQTALFAKFDFHQYPFDPVNHKLACTRIAGYTCPSPQPRSQVTNYAGNNGTSLSGRQDGVFVYTTHRAFIAMRDIKDGLSHTVAMSEISHPTANRVRWARKTAEPTWQAFWDVCSVAPLGSSSRPMGSPWVHGSLSVTQYNHVLPPNTRSCLNGTSVRGGGYTAGSSHPGGVNVMMADASVRFVTQDIERELWGALGSRDAQDLVSSDY